MIMILTMAMMMVGGYHLLRFPKFGVPYWGPYNSPTIWGAILGVVNPHIFMTLGSPFSLNPNPKPEMDVVRARANPKS